MNHPLLIIVTTDPRIDPRAAEAIRIAAGLREGRTAAPVVYLRGPALFILSEQAAAWPDGELYERCLPLIASDERPLYIPRGAALPSPSPEQRIRTCAIEDTELAELAASSRCVMRF